MYICSLIASRICTATRIMTGFVPSGRESSWQRMYFRCRFVPADRLSVVFPLTRRSDRKWTWYRRKGRRPLFRISDADSEFPCRNRRGWERRRKRRRRRREGVVARGERNTGVLFSAAGNSAQPPPTGTSDESIDLGVGLKTPLSPPHPSLQLVPLAVAPPSPLFLFRSLFLYLSLFSRFASSHSSPFRALRTLCSSLVSRFLFFSRKWTKLRRPRVSCALRPCSYSCWESLMLDDDIWRYSRNIWSYPKILKILNCFDILCVHCFNICQVKILSCNFLIYNIVSHLFVHN